MSLLELDRLIDDATQDSDLLVQMVEWPQEVLQRYALSEDELDALRTGNLELLKQFGVDDYHLNKVRELDLYTK